MRIVSIDTSVLVAAVVAGHLHDARAVRWLDGEDELDRPASWHAMAETWSTLTRLPLDPPVSARAASEAVERGLRSSVIFDALHLVAAGLVTASPGLEVAMDGRQRPIARSTVLSSPARSSIRSPASACPATRAEARMT